MMKILRLKSTAVIAFIFMLILNTLANILPLNGVTTGQVSDRYFNLFAPAGFTFMIWTVIYLMLTIFTVYQMNIKPKANSNKEIMFDKLRIYFSLSCIANGLWILAWHYDKIPITLVLIIIILYSLINIMFIIKDVRFDKLERITVKLPFEVYFGWITIAVIANFFTLFEYIGFKIPYLSLELGTSIVITLSLIIVLLTYSRFKSLSYNFVVVWAYLGILAKHLPSGQFMGLYGLIINTVSLAIAILIIFIAYEIMFRINKLKKIEIKEYEDQ